MPAGRHQVEQVWRRNRQTRREVEIAVFEHINGFDNPRRKHATLGWKSPAAFERWAAQREYLTGTKPVPDQPATCEAGAGQPTSARLNPRRMKLVDLQDFCHPDYMDTFKDEDAEDASPRRSMFSDCNDEENCRSRQAVCLPPAGLVVTIPPGMEFLLIGENALPAIAVQDVSLETGPAEIEGRQVYVTTRDGDDSGLEALSSILNDKIDRNKLDCGDRYQTLIYLRDLVWELMQE